MSPEGLPWPAPRELLLLLDFDGTLAPIAAHPDLARPHPQAAGLIARLREAGAEVWVITGRPPLQVQAHLPDVPIVGLHGLHWPGEPLPAPPPRLDDARAALRPLAERFEGAWLEDKGLGLALHVRAVDPAQQPAVIAQAQEALRQVAGLGAEGDPELSVLEGHCVLEVRLRSASKAAAVRRLHAAHPERILAYIGDDVTDEEALAALPPGGIGVRVSPRPVETHAAIRLPDPEAVMALLAELVGPLTG